MKAVTFGSAMVDIIAVLKSDSIEKISLSNAHQQFLLVEPGRKVEADSITTHIGGGAMNTAVCLSRLGCDVSPLVKTGEDASRDHVLAHASENGVETLNMLIDQQQSTGSAVMIASHEKNSAIFTQRGANTTLVEADLSTDVLNGMDLVHCAPLSGNSAKVLPTIANLARNAGAFFSSNPGIRQISTRANSVLDAAKDMDLMSINAVEAAALVPCLSALNSKLDWGEPYKTEPTLKSQDVEIGLRKFCAALHGHGPDNILVTYGGDGAWLYDGNTLHHQPVIPATVAGTAGAGDSFVSTLAWGLKSGLRAQDALLLAAHNASSVVSYVNTTDGLLTHDELMARAGLS